MPQSLLERLESDFEPEGVHFLVVVGETAHIAVLCPDSKRQRHELKSYFGSDGAELEWSSVSRQIPDRQVTAADWRRCVCRKMRERAWPLGTRLQAIDGITRLALRAALPGMILIFRPLQQTVGEKVFDRQVGRQIRGAIGLLP